MSSKEFTQMCTCGKTDWCPKNPQDCGLNNPQAFESKYTPDTVNIEDIAAPLLEKYAKR